MPAYTSSGSSNNGDETTVEIDVRDDGGGGGGGAGGAGQPYTVSVVLSVKEGAIKKKLNSGNPSVDRELTGLPSVRWRAVTVQPHPAVTRLEYTFKGVNSLTAPAPFCVVVTDSSGVPFFAEWGQIQPGGGLVLDQSRFGTTFVTSNMIDPKVLKKLKKG